jgi:hypothetical protein
MKLIRRKISTSLFKIYKSYFDVIYFISLKITQMNIKKFNNEIKKKNGWIERKFFFFVNSTRNLESFSKNFSCDTREWIKYVF